LDPGIKNGAATASRSKNTKLIRLIRDLFIEPSYVGKLAPVNQYKKQCSLHYFFEFSAKWPRLVKSGQMA
jgi:hypothetical protein